MENKNNISVDNIQDFDSRDNKKSGFSYTIILILLIVLVIVVGYMYVDQRYKTKKVVAELNSVSSEKTKVRNELNELLIDYDDLETNNDSLNTQLDDEREKIKTLLKDLKTVKASNHSQISQYKKELRTLRDIMKGFVQTIDSLNTLNIELTAENVQVKRQYQRISKQKSDLEEQNQDLSSMVDKASTIKTFNINAQALNVKGKAVKKYKKVDKFEVCFILGENVIAESGLKNVYVRIARPDELVLIESEDNLFEVDGIELAYTSFREVEYKNKETNVCIYFKNNEELIPGMYFADIFVDNKQIGSTNFELK